MQELLLSGGSEQISEILKPLIPFIIGIFVVALLIHILTGWLLARIAKKHSYPSPWLAYIPVAQLSVLLSLGGQSGKHILWTFVPFVGILVFLYFLIIATVKLCTNNGESKHFVWVLAAPFVQYWGLYRLGQPGGNSTDLTDTEKALVQTASGLIQQGKTEDELLAMMIQAGVESSRVKFIYSQAQYFVKNGGNSAPTDRKPLAGKFIAVLFIAGWFLNSIFGGAIFAAVGGWMKANGGQIAEGFIDKDLLDELDINLDNLNGEDITQGFEELNEEDSDFFDDDFSFDSFSEDDEFTEENSVSTNDLVEEALIPETSKTTQEPQPQGVRRGVPRVPNNQPAAQVEINNLPFDFVSSKNPYQVGEATQFEFNTSYSGDPLEVLVLVKRSYDLSQISENSFIAKGEKYSGFITSLEDGKVYSVNRFVDAKEESVIENLAIDIDETFQSVNYIGSSFGQPGDYKYEVFAYTCDDLGEYEITCNQDGKIIYFNGEEDVEMFFWEDEVFTNLTQNFKGLFGADEEVIRVTP